MDKRTDLDYIANINTGMIYPYSHEQWELGKYREVTEAERAENNLGDSRPNSEKVVRMIPLPDDVGLMGWDELNDYVRHFQLGEPYKPFGHIDNARQDLLDRVRAKNDDNQNFRVLVDSLPKGFARMGLSKLMELASQQGLQLTEEDSLTTPAALRTKIKAHMMRNMSSEAA